MESLTDQIIGVNSQRGTNTGMKRKNYTFNKVNSILYY